MTTRRYSLEDDSDKFKSPYLSQAELTSSEELLYTDYIKQVRSRLWTAGKLSLEEGEDIGIVESKLRTVARNMNVSLVIRRRRGVIYFWPNTKLHYTVPYSARRLYFSK